MQRSLQAALLALVATVLLAGTAAARVSAVPVLSAVPPGYHPVALRPFRGTEPSCPSPNACFVLGFKGVGGSRPALGEFDGQSLKVVAAAPAGAEALSCPTTTFCMAISLAEDTPLNKAFQYPAPVSATWSGGHWRRQPLPALPANVTSGTGSGTARVSWALQAVSCASPDSCVAVGGSFDDAADSAPPLSAPLIEHWNGRVWSRQRAAAQTGTLTSVSCASASTCVAVGADYETPGGLIDAPPEMLQNGVWTAASKPTIPGTVGDILTSVSCATATRCVAVGSADTGTIRSPYPTVGEIATWNGTSWTPSELSPMPADVQSGRSEALNYVSCPPGQTTTCLATASHGLDRPAVGMLTVIPAVGAPTSRPRSLPHTGDVDLTCATAGECLVVAEFALLQTEPTQP